MFSITYYCTVNIWCGVRQNKSLCMLGSGRRFGREDWTKVNLGSNHPVAHFADSNLPILGSNHLIKACPHYCYCSSSRFRPCCLACVLVSEWPWWTRLNTKQTQWLRSRLTLADRVCCLVTKSHFKHPDERERWLLLDTLIVESSLILRPPGNVERELVNDGESFLSLA